MSSKESERKVIPTKRDFSMRTIQSIFQEKLNPKRPFGKELTRVELSRKNLPSKEEVELSVKSSKPTLLVRLFKT